MIMGTENKVNLDATEIEVQIRVTTQELMATQQHALRLEGVLMWLKQAKDKYALKEAANAGVSI
jgi:hypothetical protein